MESSTSLQQAVAADSRAERHTLSGDLSDEYAFRQPLTVLVWPEDTLFVAAAEDIDIHAFGESAEAGMTNSRAAIAEHVARLESAGDRLSPHLIRERDYLRTLMDFLAGRVQQQSAT